MIEKFHFKVVNSKFISPQFESKCKNKQLFLQFIKYYSKFEE